MSILILLLGCRRIESKVTPGFPQLQLLWEYISIVKIKIVNPVRCQISACSDNEICYFLFYFREHLIHPCQLMNSDVLLKVQFP